MKHFKKLNAKGFGHIEIAIVVLVMAVIGGIGSYMLTKSHASTVNSSPTLTVTTQVGCQFTGRVWSGGSCAYNQCQSGSIANPSASASFHYCTGYIAANVGQGPCNVTYHRTYINNVGCAKGGSQVCYDSNYPIYSGNGTDNDSCVAPTPAPAPSPTPTPAPTPTPTATNTASVKYVSTQSGCMFTGRVWNGSSCDYKQCRSGSIVGTGSFDYCSGYIAANVGQGPCNVTYHRVYVANVGCAKVASDVNNAAVCYDPAYPNYNADPSGGGNDICVANQIAGAPTHTSTPTTTTTQQSKTGTSTTTTSTPTTAATDIPDATAFQQNAVQGALPTFAPAKPKCVVDGKVVAPKADNTCPSNATLTCPGVNVRHTINGVVGCYTPAEWNQYKAAVEAQTQQVQTAAAPVQPPANAIVATDSIAEANCHLLGREYHAKKQGNQPAGCLRACNKTGDTLAADNLVCISAKYKTAYAVALPKSVCDSLHRIYINKVGLCAQFPNQDKTNGKKVNAPQCQDGYPVYIIQAGKADECVTKGFADQLESVAQSTGHTIAQVAKGPNAAVCSMLPHSHWNASAGQCQKDRDATIGVSTPIPSQSEPKLKSPTAPNGQSWAQFCSSLGRSQSGTGCGACTSSNQHRDGTTAASHYGYDKCVTGSQYQPSQASGSSTSCSSNTTIATHVASGQSALCGSTTSSASSGSSTSCSSSSTIATHVASGQSALCGTTTSSKPSTSSKTTPVTNYGYTAPQTYHKFTHSECTARGGKWTGGVFGIGNYYCYPQEGEYR